MCVIGSEGVLQFISRPDGSSRVLACRNQFGGCSEPECLAGARRHKRFRAVGSASLGLNLFCPVGASKHKRFRPVGAASFGHVLNLL